MLDFSSYFPSKIQKQEAKRKSVSNYISYVKGKYANYYVYLRDRLTIKIIEYESNQIFWN